MTDKHSKRSFQHLVPGVAAVQRRRRLGWRGAVNDRLRVAVGQLGARVDDGAPRPLAADLALLRHE